MSEWDFPDSSRARFLLEYEYSVDKGPETLVMNCTVTEMRRFIAESEKKPIFVSIERPGQQPFPFVGTGYVWKRVSKKRWNIPS